MWLYHILFMIHHLMDSWIACTVWLLSVTLLRTFLHVFMWTYVLSSLDKHLGVELLGCRIMLFNFLRNYTLIIFSFLLRKFSFSLKIQDRNSGVGIVGFLFCFQLQVTLQRFHVKSNLKTWHGALSWPENETFRWSNLAE